MTTSLFILNVWILKSSWIILFAHFWWLLVIQSIMNILMKFESIQRAKKRRHPNKKDVFDGHCLDSVPPGRMVLFWPSLNGSAWKCYVQQISFFSSPWYGVASCILNGLVSWPNNLWVELPLESTLFGLKNQESMKWSFVSIIFCTGMWNVE